MRQVPCYLLIGNGRLAQHMRHYFSLLGLPFLSWHRGEPVAELPPLVAKATHILLLITDAAIAPFARAHLTAAKHALKIHFSGCLALIDIYGAHPLMTFAPQFYTLADYCAIPFVLDENAPPFSSLLPFCNPHVRIALQHKAKYHALCVMASNYSCLLWQKLLQTFSENFAIPAEFAFPLLQRQTLNLLQDAKSALSGPLARGDEKTLQKNLQALENDAFHGIYVSFIEAYQIIKRENAL